MLGVGRASLWEEVGGRLGGGGGTWQGHLDGEVLLQAGKPARTRKFAHRSRSYTVHRPSCCLLTDCIRTAMTIVPPPPSPPSKAYQLPSRQICVAGCWRKSAKHCRRPPDYDLK